MNWRFFRRFPIVPGLWLNVGKRGISFSTGMKGLRATFGHRGTRLTVGLPGSGLSATHLIAKKPKPETTSEAKQLLDRALRGE